MPYQISCQRYRNPEQRQINYILPAISQRTLGEDFLEFARGHQASRKGQRSEDDLHGENRHHERWNVGRAQIEFRRTHQGHAARAEGVAERGSLGNGGHLHSPQRNPDAGPQHQRDDNPFVVDNPVMQ